jgi:predicted O-methyltransferase YrrM
MRTLLTWRDINGWFYESEGVALQEVCRGKIVLEIGAWKGRSTCCIAEVAQAVVTIEHFKADDCIRKLYPNVQSPESLADDLTRNIEACGASDRVTVIHGDWKTTLTTAINIMRDGGAMPHVIFYDADHQVGPVTEFLDQMNAHSFSGVICLHDYKPGEYPESVNAVNKFARTNNRSIRVVGSLAILTP